MLPPYNIDTLQNLNTSSEYYHQTAATNDMREMALKQIAEQTGMQAGLAHESKVINTRLMMHKQQLDMTFNFNQLIYDHKLLPPVIIQQTNMIKVSDDAQTIRAGGHRYEIIRQSAFVTVPPTWRDYLYMSYQQPELPNKAVLPKNNKEQEIWAHYVVKGYAKGIQQGLSIFTHNMHQLSVDFNGMVLYKRLLAKNMVSPFYVKSKSLGITGDGNHVTIDDSTMHIADQPKLLPGNTKNWKPVAIKTNK